ncbi:hypothetical protein CKA32_005554 [Geitlerinema sp. FC II]|nr:hypothetical protein CKA32_005554 [Geitlerinema sp. FC II]
MVFNYPTRQFLIFGVVTLQELIGRCLLYLNFKRYLIQ